MRRIAVVLLLAASCIDARAQVAGPAGHPLPLPTFADAASLSTWYETTKASATRGIADAREKQDAAEVARWIAAQDAARQHAIRELRRLANNWGPPAPPPLKPDPPKMPPLGSILGGPPVPGAEGSLVPGPGLTPFSGRPPR